MALLDGSPSVGGLDVCDTTAWYVRSLPLPLPFRPFDASKPGDAVATVDELVHLLDEAYAAGREKRSFLSSFVVALQRAGTTLVNPPAVLRQHFLKLEQLDTLRSAGVPTPSSLATNDPEAVLKFSARHRGRIIYKPIAGGGLCQRVTEDDLGPHRLALLAKAPVLFQEEIQGRNLRVYVVGDRVAAAYEIVADALDYRGAETAVIPTSLSHDEQQASCRAADACGLWFTGIDIRRREDGSFAVLECNPSPMFTNIERITGCARVSQALGELLTAF